MKDIIIIGAGLAGSEAAWQAAKRDARVTLYEMRPQKMTPAHKTAGFAELVCSNSLRGAGFENAVGVLKEEMRRMGSIIMEAADATRVPAGGALAVDRHGFSDYITEHVTSHPNVTVVHEELTEIPLKDDAVTIVASGPLTEGALAEDIARRTGGDSLYFYDAAAPIVSLDSIDMTKAYRASRYGKGEAAYINCPMTEAEYRAFWQELVAAEKAPTHGFEKEKFFEGCMPVEVMASRGEDTLLFGPLKPVGLEDPKTGVRPFAVVQLRQDNADATLYNIVGFQTHLKWPEQRRVFSMIPGLEHAEFSALWRHAPQHVPQRAEAHAPDVPVRRRGPLVLRRADDGRRGLCRIGVFRPRRWHQCRARRGGRGAVCLPAGDLPRSARALHHDERGKAFPADEREFRPAAGSRRAHPRQEAEKTAPRRAGAFKS